MDQNFSFGNTLNTVSMLLRCSILQRGMQFIQCRQQKQRAIEISIPLAGDVLETAIPPLNANKLCLAHFIHPKIQI